MYFTGAIGVEGYFKTADWLYIGGIVGYEHMGGDEYTKSGTITHEDGTTEAQYEYKGKLSIDMLMPMISIKPFWFNHQMVSMYSKIAAGAFCKFAPVQGANHLRRTRLRYAGHPQRGPLQAFLNVYKRL